MPVASAEAKHWRPLYHIRECKTSVSQHGLHRPPPSSSVLTSGLLTSSSGLETDDRCNDIHMP